ncbi:hypothetical protein [Winslowiella toletana]|uniref:hypothetical protein n=1 Tax=Winslowiella toletana TaxID=92490 RepID=UPI0028BE940E|nr:hypothetical protein [Winslowiella toletana]WNN42841.1 hypothetical protein RIN69_14075 [Winslowiella toletana]
MNDIDLAWLKDELEEWQGFYEHPADRKQHAFFTALIGAIEELEVAQRERDNAQSSRDLHYKVSQGLNERLMAAEAELKRRDAQEPVAWISERNLNNLGKQFSVYVKHEPVMVRPVALYTHPAVLPPELSEE